MGCEAKVFVVEYITFKNIEKSQEKTKFSLFSIHQNKFQRATLRTQLKHLLSQ